MDNNEFRNQIDELFRLFNKLMERYPMEDMPGLSQMQLQQMKIFLKNYEQMKDQISFEMMGQVNEPMRQMIGLFIQQLREELGEEAIQVEETPQQDVIGMTVQDIDTLLSKGGLSEEEIDRLLDERARLQHNNL